MKPPDVNTPSRGQHVCHETEGVIIENKQDSASFWMLQIKRLPEFRFVGMDLQE
jgi:hypothetical protein